MNRWPFALAVLALSSVLVAAAEQASGEAFEKRLSAFFAQAKADREREGLDAAAAKQRYPTPELQLTSAGQAERCAKPGETVDLGYTGKLPKGSLAGFTCSELEVLDLTAAEGKVSAKVRVAKAALPRECRLTAVSSTSAIRRDFPAVRIAGKYVWELQLGNGWTARWTWQAPGCGALAEATSEWRDKGGKVLGTVPLQLDGSGTRWTGTVALSPEEQEELLKEARSPEAQKDTAELQQLANAMTGECSKLEPAKMSPCFKKHQETMKPVQARMKEREKATRERNETRKAGCYKVRVEVAPDGKVTGRAQGCGAPGETPVSGKISAVAG